MPSLVHQQVLVIPLEPIMLFLDLKSSELYQNVPNPFNQATEIKFFLTNEAQQATLFIYDMQGTQLKKIELTQRGEASINLQAGTLKAGMYHYALVVDGQEVAMKRMMITD